MCTLIGGKGACVFIYLIDCLPTQLLHQSIYWYNGSRYATELHVIWARRRHWRHHLTKSCTLQSTAAIKPWLTTTNKRAMYIWDGVCKGTGDQPNAILFITMDSSCQATVHYNRRVASLSIWDRDRDRDRK